MAGTLALTASVVALPAQPTRRQAAGAWASPDLQRVGQRLSPPSLGSTYTWPRGIWPSRTHGSIG